MGKRLFNRNSISQYREGKLLKPQISPSFNWIGHTPSKRVIRVRVLVGMPNKIELKYGKSIDKA